MGRVIVLNGTSSAGKTTLASTLQARLAEAGQCWVVVGIDDFLGRLPPAWVTYRNHVGAHAEEGIAFTVLDGEVKHEIGPIGVQMLAAYRGAVAAMARAGINLIVDEVLLREADWQAWRIELAGLDATWVRVSLDIRVAEERERDRGDRMVGLARSQLDLVHRHAVYDVDVDMTSIDPATAAATILEVIRAGA